MITSSLRNASVLWARRIVMTVTGLARGDSEGDPDLDLGSDGGVGRR